MFQLAPDFMRADCKLRILNAFAAGDPGDPRIAMGGPELVRRLELIEPQDARPPPGQLIDRGIFHGSQSEHDCVEDFFHVGSLSETLVAAIGVAAIGFRAERQLNPAARFWKLLGINAKIFVLLLQKNAKTRDIGSMELSLRMLVYFHCRTSLGMILRRDQGKATKPQTGALTVTICESEVLTWSDYYDFADWLLVTSVRPSQSAGAPWHQADASANPPARPAGSNPG